MVSEVGWNLRKNDPLVFDEEVADNSKRHSLQAVELSQWFQAAVQIVSNLPAPSNSDHITLNTNTPTRVPNTTLQS